MFLRVLLSSLRKTNTLVSLVSKSPYLSAISRNYFHTSSHYCHYGVFLAENKRLVSSDILIQGIANEDDTFLKLIWNDGSESRYPYVYLRENCKCPECFQPSSKQRIVDVLKDGMLNISIKEATISENGAVLKCLWPNGHHSVYPTAWLYDRHMMVEKHEVKPKKIVHDNIVVWDKTKMQDQIPSYDYEAIMEDDKSLFNALYSLYQYGLMLVDNGPKRKGVWKDLAKRIGYIRPTHYGEYFDVETKGDPSNMAYTTDFIPFHVDLLYLSRAPDIQILHCIEQAGDNMGGDSLFVDAFDVAKKQMEINYARFEVLSRVRVPFQDVGADVFGEFSLGYLRPIIELNDHGRMTGVMFNNFTRTDSFRNLTPEDTVKFYNAFYHLNKMMYKPENTVTHRLQPGQTVFFHNTRVLHSRTEISPGATRLLQGNYYDWDVVFSKLRCIQAKLSLDTSYLHGETNDFF